LATTSLFYNHHLAREHIGETGVAVLVEGPGDLWRLVEGGVDVGLGTFGASLSDEQVVMMELSGCINLVIPRDRDAAGAAFEADLKARLGRSFRLHFVELPTHDVGELTPGQVKEIILPLVRRCSW
jgi:DNA primase